MNKTIYFISKQFMIASRGLQNTERQTIDLQNLLHQNIIHRNIEYKIVFIS